MKIAHLSVGDSLTTRLTNWQAKEGHQVHLIMLQPAWENLEGVKSHILPIAKPWGYYLNVFALKELIKTIAPDILHVHYATGCGTLGRLTKFTPSVLSVWGTDVMVTPNESKRMRLLVKKNLRHYNWVCSTSKIMTKTVNNLCPELENVTQIPIGVNTSTFYPKPVRTDDYITVGTVKVLDHIYGIDILIKSFAKAFNYFSKKEPIISNKMRLKIVGGGSKNKQLQFIKDLKALTNQMGIDNITQFVGRVNNVDVPKHLNDLDIYVAMSRIESFGVAVVEASACEIPVVVSDVGGLPEIVKNNETGFIVESENVDQCAEKLIILIKNNQLRKRMGKSGRDFIKQNYEWKNCFEKIQNVYSKVKLNTK